MLTIELASFYNKFRTIFVRKLEKTGIATLPFGGNYRVQKAGVAQVLKILS